MIGLRLVFGEEFGKDTFVFASVRRMSRVDVQKVVLFFFNESFFNMGLDRREWGILAFGMILLFIVSFISQKKDVRDYIKEQNIVMRYLIFGVLFAMIIVYGYYGSQFNAADFIYGRF